MASPHPLNADGNVPVIFYVEVAGRWTAKFISQCKGRNIANLPVRLLVDGPHLPSGTAYRQMESYNHVTFVASASRRGPTLSCISDILRTARLSGNRTLESISVVFIGEPWFAWGLANPYWEHPGVVVTASEPLYRELFNHSLDNVNNGDRLPMTRLALFHARNVQQFNGIFSRIYLRQFPAQPAEAVPNEIHQSKIGVFCAVDPSSFHSIRKVVSRYYERTAVDYLHIFLEQQYPGVIGYVVSWLRA